MAAAVESLDAHLQAQLRVKPPGVAKSRIEAIRTICAENAQSEAALTEKIATHFQKTPNTHKLGVVYVVDAITRRWIEMAMKTGQLLTGSAAANGTFAGGVHRMSQLVPSLMKDTIQNAPDDQKDRIAALIKIWENGTTFPADMLADFRRQLDARSLAPKGNATATAAPLSQGPVSQPASQPAQVPATQPSASAVPNALLASLGALTGQATVQPPVQPPQLQQLPQTAQSLNQLNGAATTPAANPLLANPLVANLLTIIFTSMGQNALDPTTTDPAGALRVQLVQAILQNPAQVTPETLPQILAALQLPSTAGAAPANTAAPPAVASQINTPVDTNGPQTNGMNGNKPAKRDRERSGSPDYKRRRVSPPNPNRRGSPSYGAYDPSTASVEAAQVPVHDRRDRGGRGGRGRHQHRQRTPPPQQPTGPSPSAAPQSNRPKWIEYDSSLPQGSIKVMSRTLFVGGVSASEQVLKDIFTRFGQVQSCIVNHDKRHAFVKMVSRDGAVTAKQALDGTDDPELLNMFRSTRWGVGYGPRECTDYATGISVIPIHLLTEADRRWMLTAEYGGTGGRALEPGMVVEEPDIEIGAGVSSKAISRRIGVDNPPKKQHGFRERGGDRGGYDGGHERGNDRGDRNFTGGHGKNRKDRGGHHGGGGQGGHRGGHQSYQHQHPGHGRGQQAQPRVDPAAPEPNTVGVPPAVPGFGFQLPGFTLNYS